MIRKMTLLSAIFIISLPLSLSSSGWTPCPISIPTVSFVSRCPSNALEWATAAEKKNCKALEQHQNCSRDDSFEYHCVLNLDGTKLMEVCAPIWYMSGYCARFSLADQKIVNDPGLDCTKFEPSCPTRFPSNESYRYQKCYNDINKTLMSSHTIAGSRVHEVFNCRGDVTNIILITLQASFGTLTILLLILLFVRFETKWAIHLMQRNTSNNDSTRSAEDCIENIPLLGEPAHRSEGIAEEDTHGTRNEDDTVRVKQKPEKRETGIQTDMFEETDEWADFVSLSGKMKERYALKDIKTVRDLREKLSKSIQEPIESLSIVDQENGKIYPDDSVIEPSKKKHYMIMFGNKDRNKSFDEDGTVEVDVISNKHITKCKCMMCCGHFTATDTLFDWIKNELCTYEDEEIQCPKCEEIWNIEEVLERCNLSEDETLFFKRVKEIYTTTKTIMQRCYGDFRNDEEIADNDDDSSNSAFSS